MRRTVRVQKKHHWRLIRRRRKKMKGSLYTVLLGLLTLVMVGASDGLAAGTNGSNSSVNHEELHIAFMSPLAGSCSCDHVSQRRAATGYFYPGILPAVFVARDHINKYGSYLSGRMLSVDVMQTQEVRKNMAYNFVLFVVLMLRLVVVVC